MHARHLGVLRQKLRDPQSVVILPLHPHRQRLDAAQQQPCGVGIHHPAQGGASFVDLLDQVLPSGNDAADQVGVSGEIFGAGVHHQVNAEVRRALVDGRGKSAVNEGHEVVLPGERSHFVQVNHSQQWVGRRFQVEQLRVRTNGAGMLIVFGGVHEGRFDAEFRQPLAEEFCRAAINIALSDDMVSALQQGQH